MWKATLKSGHTKWHSMNWGGNGSVLRSGAIRMAEGIKLFGRAAGIPGSLFSGSEGYQAVRRRDKAEAKKPIFDMIMETAGTFGGPCGAAAAGFYFGVEMTVGWGTVGKTVSKSDPYAAYPHELAKYK